MSETTNGRYRADLRWTTHGAVHVRADDWGGLGFGQGWACARDHAGTIVDQIVKVTSRRARFHGAGPEGRHLASDFGYRALGVVDRAPAWREEQPPELREVIAGYVAGVNAWIEEATATPGTLPAWCDGAEWMQPIDELDLYAYLVDVALLGSGRNLAPLIGRAEAPGPDGPVPPAPLGDFARVEAASNGWAFGGDVTASGHGIVMANPHFPWEGEARFWECHLTIPGEVDVYGVSLLGAPGVQMGFNRDIAWAHTFSKGHRFTLARLDLVDGDPTRYRHGDVEREMTPTTHAVEVRGDDGGVTTVERTLWTTHHGPMVNLPLLGWGTEVGFTYRDANLDQTGVLAQFLAMDRARGMDDLQSALRGGLPWVNTLAADRTGRAWYIDASSTPNLSAEAQERFRRRLETDPVAALLYESRVALLDGSDPGDDWVDDPTALRPGLVPFDRLPQLERRDYVANANDSHWLAHPDEPLTGYSVLHGFERTPQSPRTRQNHRVVQRMIADGPVTRERATAAVLGNESLTAELLRDAVVERARAAGTVTVAGEEVDLGPAADVLAAWDGRVDLDSVGAVLWREVMGTFPPADRLDAGPIFAVPFDPDDPVATPRDLADPPAGGDDPIVAAVALAVQGLIGAGVPIDAPLGAVQHAVRGDERVPVHGGGEADGVCNILEPTGNLAATSLEPVPPRLPAVPGRPAHTGLGLGGYRCTYGTSWYMVVELTDDGPVAEGLLAYGQSGDPRSPHHHDGIEAYAAKAVRPLLFTDAQIDADPNLVRRTVTG
mgnify:FL=1